MKNKNNLGFGLCVLLISSKLAAFGYYEDNDDMFVDDSGMVDESGYKKVLPKWAKNYIDQGDYFKLSVNGRSMGRVRVILVSDTAIKFNSEDVERVIQKYSSNVNVGRVLESFQHQEIYTDIPNVTEQGNEYYITLNHVNEQVEITLKGDVSLDELYSQPDSFVIRHYHDVNFYDSAHDFRFKGIGIDNFAYGNHWVSTKYSIDSGGYQDDFEVEKFTYVGRPAEFDFSYSLGIHDSSLPDFFIPGQVNSEIPKYLGLSIVNFNERYSELNRIKSQVDNKFMDLIVDNNLSESGSDNRIMNVFDIGSLYLDGKTENAFVSNRLQYTFAGSVLDFKTSYIDGERVYGNIKLYTNWNKTLYGYFEYYRSPFKGTDYYKVSSSYHTNVEQINLSLYSEITVYDDCQVSFFHVAVSRCDDSYRIRADLQNGPSSLSLSFEEHSKVIGSEILKPRVNRFSYIYNNNWRNLNLLFRAEYRDLADSDIYDDQAFLSAEFTYRFGNGHRVSYANKRRKYNTNERENSTVRDEVNSNEVGYYYSDHNLNSINKGRWYSDGGKYLSSQNQLITDNYGAFYLDIDSRESTNYRNSSKRFGHRFQTTILDNEASASLNPYLTVSAASKTGLIVKLPEGFKGAEILVSDSKFELESGLSEIFLPLSSGYKAISIFSEVAGTAYHLKGKDNLVLLTGDVGLVEIETVKRKVLNFELDVAVDLIEISGCSVNEINSAFYADCEDIEVGGNNLTINVDGVQTLCTYENEYILNEFIYNLGVVSCER